MVVPTQALGVSQLMNVVFKTRKCVSKTRNCVSKTRNFVFEMMNLSGGTISRADDGSFHKFYAELMIFNA